MLYLGSYTLVSCVEMSKDGTLIAIGTKESVVRVVRYRYRVFLMKKSYTSSKSRCLRTLEVMVIVFVNFTMKMFETFQNVNLA